MSISEIKVEMFELLAQTHDKATLLKLYKKMIRVFETSNKDWWDELPVEQQLRLTKALEEIENEENLIDHDDMRKKHAKWLVK